MDLAGSSFISRNTRLQTSVRELRSMLRVLQEQYHTQKGVTKQAQLELEQQKGITKQMQLELEQQKDALVRAKAEIEALQELCRLNLSDLDYCRHAIDGQHMLIETMETKTNERVREANRRRFRAVGTSILLARALTVIRSIVEGRSSNRVGDIDRTLTDLRRRLNRVRRHLL